MSREQEAGEGVVAVTPTTSDVCDQCTPGSPFGCVHHWGPPLNIYGSGDMGQHVCNKVSLHKGGHECRCGALAPPSDASTPEPQ